MGGEGLRGWHGESAEGFGLEGGRRHRAAAVGVTRAKGRRQPARVLPAWLKQETAGGPGRWAGREGEGVLRRLPGGLACLETQVIQAPDRKARRVGAGAVPAL